MMKSACLLMICLFSFSFNSYSKKFSKSKSFVFIPSGSFQFQDNKVSCNAFYMATTEVTNAQYREFLQDLNNENKKDELKIAIPDTSLWLKSFPYNYFEAISSVYFWHPAYDDFPVVNVSKEGAELYCKWLTDKMRNQFPDENFNDFRLPTQEEWVYAAKGGLENALYPWGGPGTINSKGCYLANFSIIGDHNITRDKDGKLVVVSADKFYTDSFEEYQILAPALSYAPNGYGLYNMSGNCAELVAKSQLVMGGSWTSPGHDIQVTSSAPYEGPHPTIGFRPVVSYVKVE